MRIVIAPGSVGFVRALAAITVMAGSVAGCDPGTGITEDRDIGIIGFPDHIEITVPDTVAVGQEFAVTVRTIGSGCTSRDGTDVRMGTLEATVTPYDITRRGPGIVCTQGIVYFIHSAEIRFNEAGVATLSFRGRDGTAVRAVAVTP